MNSRESLQKVIDYFGSQRALAEILDVRQQTISDWLNKSKRVPAERVLQLEKACNGKITRHQLRPDIYPKKEVF